MEKSFRVHTNITGDTMLNVNMKQDFDFLEILSLKLRQKDAYRIHSSNYGVIVGRVLANDAFGIPNAKVSVFIERDTSDPGEIEDIYPYSDVMSKDSSGIRYNLLPDYSDDVCYRVVGTFPRKRYLLDDSVQLEVYEKYWKYTSVTNKAGDYMIFGVPVGGHQIHVDIDLSDIGVLSQKPRDFFFKGYNLEEFDSPSQFKESTNIDGLRQIISQNKSTNVYPFWGDPENGIAAITRCDVQVNYKFEPTCVFMGAIVSDNEGHAIGHRCAPDEDSGLNDQLIAGEGTIEMIRKTPDGLVEEYPIQGNALIDSDGVWCYQIPMNLDYVGTDEYGNIVPTDDPSKGIPTRTQVRFRISKRETGDEGVSRHTAKYLVPMNPVLDESKEQPTTKAKTGLEMEKMYVFGSSTPQSCFRDLYWNNVYSVKNYVPKVQVAHRAHSTEYGALKGANLVGNQNPVPFNKLRIDLPFSYIIVCILFTIVMIIITVINAIIYAIQEVRGWCIKIPLLGRICPFKLLIPKMGCISLSAGLSDGNNVAYYPGCGCPGSEACNNSDCPEDMGSRCTKSSDNSELKDKIQQALALDYKIVKLDFYQDWLNGTLYMPLWYWRKTKKKKFLFFTIASAKNEYCSCDKEYSRLKTYVTCNIAYNDNSLGVTDSNVPEDEERWHKNNKKNVRYLNGLIKEVENNDGLKAYYYTAFQALDDAVTPQMPIDKRLSPFHIAVLYATDIILLGNLNEDNIYGIPQLFTSLPSTTANLPPIATVQENITDEDRDTESDVITGESEDAGTVITTGMDWEHYGEDQTPQYKKGLFIDLTCTYVGTKAKSCINVERLSELGVNLDSTYEMSYANGSTDFKKGMIDSDGFISKLELDDLETRATFATLNHMGFIPQDYQESIGSYQTQVPDERTGYLVPKFKYVYPVDFDGRLQPIMTRYKRDFEQAMYDEQDESYITFRLGAESSKKSSDNLEGRVRHFYYVGNTYEMPIYNNSFYFYFGINKGNTAIDKFNKLFYAPCFQRDKKPFSINIDALGKSYCPSTYGDGNEAYNGYGYIKFSSEDIVTPYSYTLYDSSANVVVPTETGMTATEFVIGGYIDENGKTIMNEGGIVKYQLSENPGEEPQPVDNLYGTDGLTNQTYILEITDANGKRMSERIELKVPKISIDFTSEGLSTKFYSTGSTRMDYICNKDNMYYGKIDIKAFSIDGFLFYVTGVSSSGYSTTNDSFIIVLNGTNIEYDEEGHSVPGITASAVAFISTINTERPGWVKECLCKETTGGSTKPWADIVDPAEEERMLENQKVVELYVYQPNRFSITVSQYCCAFGSTDDCKVVSANTTSDIATVPNGVNFNAYLSGMPVRFMLGTLTDSASATTANKSYFYANSPTEGGRDGVIVGDEDSIAMPAGKKISGWYGLHQEDTYRWNLSENQVVKRNQDMWGDFVNIRTEISDHNVKGKILEFKFNAMFSLSSAAYVVEDDPTFRFEIKGGVSPILYRTVSPKYSNIEAMFDRFILTDNNSVTGHYLYPNIVGRNYVYVHQDGWRIYHRNRGPNFNYYYSGDDDVLLGNYFAGFTNNGGYTSKTAVDTSLKVMKAPTNAKVTPMEGAEKRLGRNEEGGIGRFPYAYEKRGNYLPYLRAMFVDRRLDYELILIAPCVASNSVNLYPSTNTTVVDCNGNEKEMTVADPRELIWRSARISGITYNGVELSYDRDYNIISADTSVEYTVSGTDGTVYSSYDAAIDAAIATVVPPGSGKNSYNLAKGLVIPHYLGIATPNNRLEYSYNYSDQDVDAKTIYNTEKDMIWEEDAYPVQETETVIDETTCKEKSVLVYDDYGRPVYERDGKPGQIIKRFYEATFVGMDIRKFFWSTFNKKRLWEYATDTTNTINSVNYVYKYPHSNDSLYNGDFNRVNVINGEYPTKRFIDLGNIQAQGSYDLEIYNCSYAMTAHFEDNDTITAEALDATGITVTTTFENPITFLPPSSEIEDYANVTYRLARPVDGYSVFTTKSISINFSVNPVSSDDYNIYVAIPKIIKVMPYITGRDGRKYDGISYIKTVTPDGEIAAAGDIYNAIDEVQLYKFTRMYDGILSIFGIRGDTYAPSGVYFGEIETGDDEYTRSTFYARDVEGVGRVWLTSDSSEFQSIRYVLNNWEFDRSVSMMSVVVERRYEPKQEDFLKKELTTFEFSEIYDMRKILIKIDSENCYVEKKNLMAIDVELTELEVNASLDVETEETPDPTPSPDPEPEPEEETADGTISLEDGGYGEGVGENYTHIQTIAFELSFPDVANPEDGACEAFGNTTSISYTLKLRHGDENVYELTPSEVKTPEEGSTETKLTLIFKWTQEMGIMADSEWGSATEVSLIGKTGSNFIYKLDWFTLDYRNQEGGYDPGSKTSGMVVGEKYPTIVKIIGS